MGTFWLDSPFFSQGEHLTLHITGVRWKDKDAPPVKLNLAEGTAENLPEGTRLPGRKAPAGGMDRVPGVPADGEPDHGERVLQRGLGRGRELL